MTRDCDLFQPPSAFPIRSLKKCGVNTSVVVGRREGSMVLELESGWTLEFRGVLYIPSLRVILISVSSLEDQGYSMYFRGDSVYLWPNWVECP